MSLHPFDLQLLVWPTITIFVIAFGISLAVLRRATPALIIAAMKAGIFLIYFGWVFDGTFTYLDDWTYVERGAYLHDAGIGLSNLWNSLPILIAIGEGDHFLYFLFNAAAFGLFGTGYFAPVALNVIVSALIALLGTRLALAERLCTPGQSRIFFAFLVLHPDITAWSSLVNGKDTLVLLMHVVLLMSISQFLRGRRLYPIALAAMAVTALMFLRFYVPLVFAVALTLGAVLQLRGSTRWRVAATALLALSALVMIMGPDMFSYAADSIRANFVNPLLGVVRFLLTPIPFNTDAAFAFLDIPALLHWAMLPALVIGAWSIHRANTPFTRLLLIYALTFACLYSVYGELQGPRHRLQLDFAFAIFQFTGLCMLGRIATSLGRKHQQGGAVKRGEHA